MRIRSEQHDVLFFYDGLASLVDRGACGPDIWQLLECVHRAPAGA